jgi:hypothetical protein
MCNFKEMNKQINAAVEEIIADIMFVYNQKLTREIAEMSAATMIRYPDMLIELAAMVKDKRAARASE